MTSAIKGKIPTPNSWKPALEKFVGITGGITLLEKQVGKTTLLDISKALDEYMRLYKAGIASKAEVLTLSRAFPGNEELSKACEGFAALPVVIGGPASVEMVDREGHLITTNALSKAFDRYMGNFRTRNTMVLHSDVQVGWALPAYISQGGQIFKSGVDGNGLFFITEIRDDTRIANKVMEQINEGKLKSYSIAGSATQVQSMMKGQVPYMQVDDLELAEVTVCEKGVNQGANFELLKGCDCPTQSCADGSCLLKEHDMIGHQTGQLSPDQVNYREASEMEKNAGIMCGSCRFFNAGMSTCDLVTGMIMAGDWCSLFDPMDKSPVLENENNVREIMLMRKSDGDIDFSSTFLNWIEKKQKSGKWAEVEKEEEAEVPKVAPSNLRPNPRDIAQYSKLPPAQQRSQVQGFKTNVQETQGGRGDPRYQAQGIPQAGKKPVGTASARMAAGGLDVTRHPPTKGKGGVPQEVGQGGSASGGPRTGFASVPGAKEKLRTQDVGSTVYHNSLKSIKKLIYSVS